MDQQEIIRRLNLRGRALSKGHRRIAAFITEKPDKAAFMTAVTLGHGCGVSESTVVRFATAMGYEGYPELQAALQELVRQRLTASERFNITSEIKENDVLRTVLKNDMRNIRLTTEDLSPKDFDRAVDLLHEKRSRAPSNRARPGALKNLGPHPDGNGNVEIMSGRYGAYVKHGSVNATLPKDKAPEDLTMEEALAARAERQAQRQRPEPRDVAPATGEDVAPIPAEDAEISADAAPAGTRPR